MSRASWRLRLITPLLCITCLGLRAPVPGLQESRDEILLSRLVDKFLTAYKNRDIDALMILWSENSPDLATARKTFQGEFGATKLELKGLTVHRITSDKEKASVRVTAEIIAPDAKTSAPDRGFEKQNRTLHCVKEGQDWKISMYVPSEEELAAALASAGTDEARRALLAADQHLVTVGLARSLNAYGDRLSKPGSYSRALGVFNLVIDIASQLDDKSATCAALRGMGRVYDLTNDYDKALDYHEKSLRVAEELGDKSAISAGLNNVGKVHAALGNYPKALDYYHASLKTSEEIGNKAGVALSMNNAAIVYRLQGKYLQALEYYRESLKIREAIGDKSGTAVTLGNIGNVFYSQGNFAEALEYHQRSLKIREEVGNKYLIASTVNNIGAVHQQLGNYANAMAHFQRALKIAEEIDDKIGISAMLGGMGNIQTLYGNYTLALEHYKKSLKISEELKDKPRIADTNGTIGTLHSSRGDYNQAFRYYQRSLKIAEEIGYKGQHARMLSNIALLYRYQGNYSQALKLYEEALKVLYEGHEKDWIGATLGRIGVTYRLQGNLSLALQYYRESLRIAEEIGDKPLVASTLQSIGCLQQEQGRSDEAMETLQKSLKITEEIGSKPALAEVLVDVAKVHYSVGRYAEALETAGRGASIVGQIDSVDTLWEACTMVGKAYRVLNQPDRARQAFADAIAAVEELRGRVAGDELQHQQFFENLVSPYYQMVQLLIDQKNPVEAFSYAERAKGRTLLDTFQSGRVDFTKTMTVSERNQESALAGEVTSLNAQINRERARREPDHAHLASLELRLRKARLDHEAFQTSLYAAHPELKVERGQIQPLSIDQAGTLIPDAGTALLEYAVTEEKTFLFVLTKIGGAERADPTLKVYTLNVTAKDLAGRVARFRQHLADRRAGFYELSNQLYELLLAPARAELQNKTNLVIVPDGALWELPFQALQPKPNLYLIEESAISYAPSFTVLREMSKRRRVPGNGRQHLGTLAAFGNPSLGSETAIRLKSVFMDERLAPLPEAERQVRRLGDLYGARRSKIYVGPDAREDVAKTEATKCRILHLATHGIINHASPMYSQLVLAQTEASDIEDGLLEAWEVMKLDLNADLVVLSACDTGRGRIGAGEGVVGMAWAFFVAGCPTTVVSLWKVESYSTTELMIEFHKNLKPRLDGRQYGVRKDQALRAAALKLLKSNRYRHPFYWAAFVMVGDGG